MHGLCHSAVEPLDYASAQAHYDVHDVAHLLPVDSRVGVLLTVERQLVTRGLVDMPQSALRPEHHEMRAVIDDPDQEDALYLGMGSTAHGPS